MDAGTKQQSSQASNYEQCEITPELMSEQTIDPSAVADMIKDELAARRWRTHIWSSQLIDETRQQVKGLQLGNPMFDAYALRVLEMYFQNPDMF